MPSYPYRQPQRIFGLDMVRGLAAVQVLFNHVSGKLIVLFPSLVASPWLNVHYSVTIFFLISGFITMLVAEKKIGDHFSFGSISRFLRDRILRFYPAYLCTLAITVVLVVGASIAKVNIPANMAYAWNLLPFEVLMIQGWHPPGVWNSPAWSLNVFTWSLILLFPPAFFLLRKIQSRAALFLILTVLLLAYSYYRGAGTTSTLASYHARIHFPFLIGLVSFQLWRMLPPLKVGIANGFIVLGLLAYYAGFHYTFEGPLPFGYNLFNFCVILLFLWGAAESTSFLARLGEGPLRLLGQLSFAIYLSHVIVQRVLTVLLPTTSFADSSLPVRLVILLIYVSSYVAGALLLHYLVEKPCEAYRKRKFARPAATGGNTLKEATVPTKETRSGATS